MKMSRLLLILLLIYSCSATAQNSPRPDAVKSQSASTPDTSAPLAPLKVEYITEPDHNTHFYSIDTTLNGWHLNKPVNADAIGRIDLGDAYTPTRNINFNPWE